MLPPTQKVRKPVHGLFDVETSTMTLFRFTCRNLVTTSSSSSDKDQWTSRDVEGSEPPTSPRSEHFTGPGT